MLDCLFVLRDLGETRALVPVIERLTEQGRHVEVLAVGQSTGSGLINSAGNKIRYTVPDNVAGVKTRLGTKADDFGGAAGLQATFADEMDAPKLAEHLEAFVTVSGVVARSQRDFLAAAKQLALQKGGSHLAKGQASCSPGDRPPEPVRRIGFYGSLAVNLNCALLQASPLSSTEGQAGSFVPFLDALWVPMQSLIDPIMSRIGIDRAVVRAVGQPEVEEFTASLPALAERAVDVRSRLQVAPEKSLVFFASGRDEPGKTIFRSAFVAFLQGVKETIASGKAVQVVVGVHPACSGTQEDELIEVNGLGEAVRTIKTVTRPLGAGQFSTNELMVAADKVLSWNSTSASQLALSPSGANKVMFVAAEGPPELFAAVMAGLAAQATTSTEVARFLRTKASQQGRASSPTALIPARSVATMAKHIDEAIVTAQRQALHFSR